MQRTAMLSPKYRWGSRKKPSMEVKTSIEGFFIAAVATCRLVVFESQYVVVAIGNDTFHSTRYDYVTSQMRYSTWWNTLYFATDSIAPFILLFSVVIFSVGIKIIVVRREKSQIFEQASTQQQLEIKKQSLAIIRLCFALSFLFVCNQLGYILIAIAVSIRTSPSFACSNDEMIFQIRVLCFVSYSYPVKVSLECLSKSLNFFIYILFTRSFREEFKQSLRKVACHGLSL